MAAAAIPHRKTPFGHVPQAYPVPRVCLAGDAPCARSPWIRPHAAGTAVGALGSASGVQGPLIAEVHANHLWTVERPSHSGWLHGFGPEESIGAAMDRTLVWG